MNEREPELGDRPLASASTDIPLELVVLITREDRAAVRVGWFRTKDANGRVNAQVVLQWFRDGKKDAEFMKAYKVSANQ